MNSAEDTTQSGGFPHSEILGSTVARTFPRLIAACHVLHRLSTPRHSPDALHYLFPPHTSDRPALIGNADQRGFLVGYRPSACLSPLERTRPGLQTTARQEPSLVQSPTGPDVREDRRVSHNIEHPVRPNTQDNQHKALPPRADHLERSHSH
jgi:hypothetical protein